MAEEIPEMMTLGDAVRMALAVDVSTVDWAGVNHAIDSRDFPKIWNALRRFYAAQSAAIKASPDRLAFDIYAVDFPSIFSTIETAAWVSIRGYGLPFYPQYPVGKYFADFADPHQKIAIECDGRAWHSSERDEIRDQEFKRLGWRVIRIPGWAFFRENIDWMLVAKLRVEGRYDEADLLVKCWLAECADGTIAAVAHCFYELVFDDETGTLMVEFIGGKV